MVNKNYKMVYVGETYQSLVDHFVEHKQSVTNGKSCLVGEHFLQEYHSVKDMKVTALLETCSGKNNKNS